MKKVLYILIIIVLLFVLSGCNKYRYNKFNENLEFDEELSGEEYADLIKKVVEKWKDFSKIKMKFNTEQSLDEIKIETTATFKAYSNSIIQLIGLWNDYQTPSIYLPDKPTLAVGLQYLFSKMETLSYPMMFATIIIAILPILILFAAFSKTIMENTSVGGLKG